MNNLVILDTLHRESLVFDFLDNSNYTSWRKNMRILFMRMSLLDLIDHARPPDATPAWDTANKWAFSEIYFRCWPDIQASLSDTMTSGKSSPTSFPNMRLLLLPSRTLTGMMTLLIFGTLRNPACGRNVLWTGVQQSQESSHHQCGHCYGLFPSRNQLHAHIKLTNHYVDEIFPTPKLFC